MQFQMTAITTCRINKGRSLCDNANLSLHLTIKAFETLGEGHLAEHSQYLETNSYNKMVNVFYIITSWGNLLHSNSN